MASFSFRFISGWVTTCLIPIRTCEERIGIDECTKIIYIWSCLRTIITYKGAVGGGSVLTHNVVHPSSTIETRAKEKSLRNFGGNFRSFCCLLFLFGLNILTIITIISTIFRRELNSPLRAKQLCVLAAGIASSSSAAILGASE